MFQRGLEPELGDCRLTEKMDTFFFWVGGGAWTEFTYERLSR